MQKHVDKPSASPHPYTQTTQSPTKKERKSGVSSFKTLETCLVIATDMEDNIKSMESCLTNLLPPPIPLTFSLFPFCQNPSPTSTMPPIATYYSHHQSSGEPSVLGGPDRKYGRYSTFKHGYACACERQIYGSKMVG